MSDDEFTRAVHFAFFMGVRVTLSTYKNDLAGADMERLLARLRAVADGEETIDRDTPADLARNSPELAARSAALVNRRIATDRAFARRIVKFLDDSLRTLPKPPPG